MHFGHGRLPVLFELELDEQVASVRADLLFTVLHQPVVHNGSILREPFKQVFMVVRPLLFCEMSGHISCEGVGDSEDSGGSLVRRSRVNGEGGLLVLDDVDGGEGCCLGLACSLGLGDDRVAVDGVPQPDYPIVEALEQLYLFHATHAAGFFD